EYDETNSQGEYYQRLNLDPGESMSYYTVLFVGDSVDDLKAKSVQIEDFISSGMNPAVYAGLPCIPYLDKVITEAPHTFHFKWYSYSDPDYFLIGTKEYGAPASQWNQTNVGGDIRAYSMMGYDPDLWYELKITAVYNSNSDEILYLDSDVQMVSLSYTANPGNVTPPVQTSLNTYPNPFRESTRIEYELDKREQVKLEVYNLKGQKVRSLYSGIADLGINRQQWDGRDENSVLCSSGVYYLKLQSGSKVIKRKMLLLKY
ncbi:MAG: T9SS type A sorting domain-containing protein, partial [Candidatus Cloacimonadaceae bacterium]|nr:T9SS type A sorting domain-containing protein [Candidatus Cloacimonadota bacterium]